MKNNLLFEFPYMNHFSDFYVHSFLREFFFLELIYHVNKQLFHFHKIDRPLKNEITFLKIESNDSNSFGKE